MDAVDLEDEDVDAEDPKDADMEPGDRDEDPDKDRGVEKDSGPGSESSHLSGRSVADVCGDCGLIPCTCGPNPQDIPGSTGAEAEAEAKADAQAHADAAAHAAFKEREELEQRPVWVLVCPACRMKHLWRLGEEPWGECCGVPMTDVPAAHLEM